MHKNTERYIELFNELESVLKESMGKTRHVSFQALVGEAAQRDSFIRSHQRLLRDIADLRNVLVHGEGRRVMAVPSDEAIAILERIVSKYTRPATVYDICQRNVVIVRPTRSLEEALRIMRKHDYTKIPVYDDQGYVGLLTGSVITRWFASRIDGNGDVMTSPKEITVGDVLAQVVEEKRVVEEEQVVVEKQINSEKQAVTESYSESTRERVAFVPKSLSIYQLLEQSQIRRPKTGVYIITQNGKGDEKPLGIITEYDYPKLLGELAL